MLKCKGQTTNLIKAISTHDNNISNFFYRGELVGDYHRFIKQLKIVVITKYILEKSLINTAYAK